MSNVFRIELKRARVLRGQGAMDAAEAQYFAYLRAMPHDENVTRECGHFLMDNGKFSQARRLWQKLLADVGDEPESLAQIGICFLYEDRAKDALKPLRRALALQEDNISIHFALAGALTHLDRDEQALAHLQYVTRHAPDEAEGAYVEYVCALCRLERYEQALNVVNEGIDVHADCDELYFRKALCLGAMGQMQESIACLRQTIELNADHVHAWNMMARIDDSIDKTYSRFVCLRRLFDLLPEDGEIAMELGMAAYEKEQLDVALAATQRAIAQLPDHVLALHLRATVLRVSGDITGACECLERACTLEPTNHYVLPDFGAALLAVGKAAEAESILTRALALSPNDESSRENLLLAKKMQPQRPRAR